MRFLRLLDFQVQEFRLIDCDRDIPQAKVLPRVRFHQNPSTSRNLRAPHRQALVQIETNAHAYGGICAPLRHWAENAPPQTCTLLRSQRVVIAFDSMSTALLFQTPTAFAPQITL